MERVRVSLYKPLTDCVASSVATPYCTSKLPALLVAGDKYGCFETFNFVLRAVWENWLAKRAEIIAGSGEGLKVGTEGTVAAVCMAWLFKERERFKEAMDSLLRHATRMEIKKAGRLGLVKIMPKGFLEGLVSA